MQHDAYSLLEAAIIPRRIVAENQYFAGGPVSVSFQNLDGRCLACAIGAEEGKYLPCEDTQINAPYGLGLAV